MTSRFVGDEDCCINDLILSTNDLPLSIAIARDTFRRRQRVLGAGHPLTKGARRVCNWICICVGSSVPVPAPADAPVRGASTPAFTFGDAARALPPPGSIPDFGAAARASTFSFGAPGDAS